MLHQPLRGLDSFATRLRRSTKLPQMQALSMNMIELLSPVVVAAGIFSGIVLGATIQTETERKVRRIPAGRWLPFSDSTLLGLIFNQIIFLVILASLFSATCMAILHFGNAYPLSKYDSITLSFSMLFGAAGAKWFRYRYWRKHT